MNAPGFYVYGLGPGPDGHLFAAFTTDSPDIFQYVADHSHNPTALDMHPSPMPLRITCAAWEADEIGDHLDRSGALCIGLDGQMGYAILHSPNPRLRRIVVGSPHMAEWLHVQLGDRYHTYPNERVESMSGRYGWTFNTDTRGAEHIDTLLSALGASRVAP